MVERELSRERRDPMSQSTALWRPTPSQVATCAPAKVTSAAPWQPPVRANRPRRAEGLERSVQHRGFDGADAAHGHAAGEETAIGTAPGRIVIP